ncbi:hypothetical protein FN976_22385 [Caenimonas sedimenti]|uniref:Uncharacterized protein n=1 Tax=Caenimonas sedimenti TaxID=2596921 RepID=A0A562ZK04_9BURK|nr:hypothetical protein [Caenimonas sedimenti]TWO68741.1 hypothetical protein FN976_22385 [Caenimonas sedimenti]
MKRLACLALLGAATLPAVAQPVPGAPVARVVGVRLQAQNAPSLDALTTASSIVVLVDGMPGADCALAISSTAAVVQPAPFQIGSQGGFPASRKLGTYLRGTHEVVVAPAQIGAVPACAGLPRSVTIKVQ